MEFNHQEDTVVQSAAVVANEEAVVLLTEVQLLAVGGGIADVTLS